MTTLGDLTEERAWELTMRLCVAARQGPETLGSMSDAMIKQDIEQAFRVAGAFAVKAAEQEA